MVTLLNASHNKQTDLDGAVNATVGTLTVTSSTGFPVPPFGIVVDAATANEETIVVQSWGGTGNNTWTVLRAQDGTGATPGSVGYAHGDEATVDQFMIASYITKINEEATTHTHTGLDGSAQIPAYAASTASTATVTLPSAPMDAAYPITGNTPITSITAGQAGRKATLIFASADCIVVNGSNLKLAGRNFISTVLRTLSLVSDGTNWIETERGAFGTTLPTTLVDYAAASAGTIGEVADIGHIHAVPVAQRYNSITNPSCDIFQTGDSPSTATDSTTWCDSWRWFYSGGGTVQHLLHGQNSTLSGIADSNFVADALRILTTTADASIGTTEYYMLRQGIEGYDCQVLQNGMSLSFYMFTSKAGIYSISLSTRGSEKIYVMEANSPTNTWTYFKFENISAPSSWSATTNMRTQTGLFLRVMLAGGTDYQTSSINTWNTAGKFVSSNQVNGVDSTSNSTYLYGVNLIPGPIAMPYRPFSYSERLAKVMRYRQVFSGSASSERIAMGMPYTTSTSLVVIPFGIPMMAAPAMTIAAASDLIIHYANSTTASTAVANSLPTTQNTTLTATTAAVLTVGQAITAYLATGKKLVFESYPT